MFKNNYKIRIAAILTAAATILNAVAPGYFLPQDFGIIRAYADNVSGTVNTDRLNVRSGPGTNYDKVAVLGAGTAVTITSETTGSDGSTWYAISFSSGTGYARYDYITKNVTYGIQSADFESYLSQQGFPESYKNALRGLHEKYPNWVFVAQRTGLDWNTVLTEESRIGKNLVANTSISSWKSIAQGAFDWASNYWPGFDGATWVQASSELIAYYLDPRNFLADPYVFQFEIQTYDPSIQTREGLMELIDGTFLDSDATVPVEGSEIEGGTIIPGSTYTAGTSLNTGSGSSQSTGGPSSSGSSSGSSVIGPGGSSGSSNVIIGVGVDPGSSGNTSTDGPYRIISAIDSLTGVITSYAGEWQHQGDSGNYTWYYVDDSGNRLAGGWYWLDGNNDGISECYYFYPDGTMAANTVVDGYTVDSDGKWIGEDGSIQTQTADTSSPASEVSGQLKKLPYADIIMHAASRSGVSPYVIASTILQEQGSGNSDLISGSSSSYPGYYNFFNTGAYEHDGMSAVTAGLKYASEKGWDSIEKSIVGGAVNYGTNYVNQGQDTYYLKKFNVQGSNLYNHQYMTHVLAAASEGAKVSEAYSQGFKNSALEFKIPVYNNMPETSCSLPVGDGNPNNKLSGLSVDGYTITPTFNMDTAEYSLIVDGSSSTININAQTIDSKATVTGAGSTALNVGLNEINIKVTAENGSERNYKLSITRRDNGGQTADGSQTVQTPGPSGGTENIIDNSGASGPGGGTDSQSVIIDTGSQDTSTVIIGQGPQ